MGCHRDTYQSVLAPARRLTRIACGSFPLGGLALIAAVIPRQRLSDFLPTRLTSPGLILGRQIHFRSLPQQLRPIPFGYGNSFANRLDGGFSSASYARKFRTIRSFPSESKLVTRWFHPAGMTTVVIPL
jgi:hypothetical protein